MVFHFSGDGKAKAHDIVYTALIGVILIVVLPFAVLALLKNRYGRDPARRFVPWLKASFLVFSLMLCLLFVQGILCTVSIYDINSSRGVIRAALHLGYLAELFRTVSAATVMVFLLELGPGMHYAIDGATRMFDRVIRYTAYALAAVVIALAVAYYGLFIDFQVNYTDRTTLATKSGALDRIQTINNLMAATAIILFAASLVITSLSIYTFLQRKFSPLKSASTLYLVASLLNLLGSTWNFAYAVHWLFHVRRTQPYYAMTLSIILAWWSRGILLVIAFFIALKSGSRGGVWSRTGKYSSMDSEARTRP